MDLEKKGMLFIVFTAIVSGISIFINFWAVKGFDSSVFTFSKNLLVAIFLLTIILAFSMFKDVRKLSRKDWLKLAGLGLIGGSIPFLLFFRGIQLANGSIASFIHKAIFIPVIVLAFFFLREKPNKWMLLGAGLLLGGTYLLVLPKLAWTIGLMFIAIAVLLWAADNVYAKYLLKDMSGTLVAFGRMFFGSLFMLVFLFATGKAGMVIAMSAQQYLWILLTGVLLLLFVFSYYNGLKHVKVTTAASLLLLGLPITALLDAIFKGTAVSLASAMGIVLIFAGIVLIAFLRTTSEVVVAQDGRA
ncbi:MAG: DMT family transporter [Nanoarchaeota archaeon]